MYSTVYESIEELNMDMNIYGAVVSSQDILPEDLRPDFMQLESGNYEESTDIPEIEEKLTGFKGHLMNDEQRLQRVMVFVYEKLKQEELDSKEPMGTVYENDIVEEGTDDLEDWGYSSDEVISDNTVEEFDNTEQSLSIEDSADIGYVNEGIENITDMEEVEAVEDNTENEDFNWSYDTVVDISESVVNSEVQENENSDTIMEYDITQDTIEEVDILDENLQETFDGTSEYEPLTDNNSIEDNENQPVQFETGNTDFDNEDWGYDVESTVLDTADNEPFEENFNEDWGYSNSDVSEQNMEQDFMGTDELEHEDWGYSEESPTDEVDDIEDTKEEHELTELNLHSDNNTVNETFRNNVDELKEKLNAVKERENDIENVSTDTYAESIENTGSEASMDNNEGDSLDETVDETGISEEQFSMTDLEQKNDAEDKNSEANDKDTNVVKNIPKTVDDYIKNNNGICPVAEVKSLYSEKAIRHALMTGLIVKKGSNYIC